MVKELLFSKPSSSRKEFTMGDQKRGMIETGPSSYRHGGPFDGTNDHLRKDGPTSSDGTEGKLDAQPKLKDGVLQIGYEKHVDVLEAPRPCGVD